MMHRLTAALAGLALLGSTAFGNQAPTNFKKLDFYIQQGDEMDDEDAQLLIDPGRRLLVFAHEDDPSRVFATVEWDRITSVSYENSKHARITAGLLVAWPLFFLKGKKHWLTVTYGPGPDGDAPGYVFARMDKDNFQAILAAINGYTGYEIRRIEEDGQISVLYPGVQPAERANVPPDAARGAAAPAPEPAPGTVPPAAGQDRGSSATGALPAAPLPPAGTEGRGGTLPAAPLPTATVTTPTLTQKGVQWTERAAGEVGYVWGAEVTNPNAVEVSTEVVLTLQDASGMAIITDRFPLVVPANDSKSFTEHGEIDVASASRGTQWAFDVVMPDTPASESSGASAPSPPTSSRGSTSHPRVPADAAEPGGVGPGVGPPAATPAAEIEPVPLTDDVTPPQLLPETAAIELQAAGLQDLDLKGKLITLRCLVRADGSVADARVFRISPPLSLRTAEEDLEEAVRRSAIAYWRFQPARRAGQAVPVWRTLTIRYEPSDSGG